MENSWYSLDVSPLWAMVAVFAALAISVLLYSKKGTPWSKNVNILLGFLRFSAVFLTILLLLNPLLKFNQNEIERPVIAYAIDNSESVAIRSSQETLNSLRSWIANSTEELSDDYQVEHLFLDNSTDSLSFDQETTNLSALLNRVENIYEGRNLQAVILLSDGIPNQGQSPAFGHYPFPVYSVGLGDTIPPKDIAITNVLSNKVAYQGNEYPVRVTLHQKGFEGKTVNVSIYEGSKKLRSKNLTLSETNHTTNFILKANDAGLKRLTAQVEILDGESSKDNNEQDLYIDIIEGKENILILAPAPHPDINAIRSVLRNAENYSTYVYIPGVHKSQPSIKNFDVIIEHQAFSGRVYGNYSSNGKWMIIGDRISRGALNEVNFIEIRQSGNQTDQVKPAYNQGFSRFILSNDLINRTNDYPPVSAPFGQYAISGPTEVLFYQQVGNITTERPMMCFFDDGTVKQAVSVGTGLWRWKLQESASEGSADLFKEFVLKTIQYLSIKVQKKRFVVRPRQNEYTTNDHVFIDTEVYNEIYERSYGNTISLTITNESGVAESFELIDNPSNSSFNIGSKPPGIYEYSASVTEGGKTFQEKGSFAVKEIKLEGIQLAANHNLLRTISKNSNGKFFPIDQTSQLSRELLSQDSKPIIHTNERFIPLISVFWIILLIAGLLTIEWFLRKYLGAY